jgi:hypothetical protein
LAALPAIAAPVPAAMSADPNSMDFMRNMTLSPFDFCLVSRLSTLRGSTRRGTDPVPAISATSGTRQEFANCALGRRRRAAYQSPDPWGPE